jgi:hypothetical protein
MSMQGKASNVLHIQKLSDITPVQRSQQWPDYGLDDRGSILGRDNDRNFCFRHRCDQTSPGAYPASYPKGIGALTPKVN